MRDYKSRNHDMTVTADQPITTASEDRFGRSEFAARIARVISSTEDTNSIVISVNAPWGEGKTSILNMIEEQLRHCGNILVVRFNPWRFPDEERLLSNFFKTLEERLEVDLRTVSEKVGGSFKDILTCLGAVQIPMLSATGVKDVVERVLPKADIETAKQRISDALRSSPKKVVIFLDDIDRLDKDEIQAVFRLVKLTADFPNTAYVLAFDDAFVATVLGKQIGDAQEGHRFVEKIVQVPLPVPPADRQALRQMAFEGVESAFHLAAVELKYDEGKTFVTVFDKSFNRMLSSPRAVKRYANMLSFALPILKDEANLLDLILIEGVRAFFPNLYKAIWAHSELFLRDSLEIRLAYDKETVKRRFDEVKQAFLTGLDKETAEGALFVIRVLFPETREYGLGLLGHHSLDRREPPEETKRLCSGEYFRRYFTYGIPPNDVSDKKIASLIENLENSNVEQIISTFGNLSDGNRGSVVVQKLHSYVKKIPSDSAGKLVRAITRSSDLIRESHPDDNLFGLGSLAQAASLLRSLLGRIEDADQREVVAKEAANNIERLPLGYEFCQRIRKFKKEEGSSEFVAVVSDPCEREILRIFADKLARAAQTVPLEESHPLFKRAFYIHWRWSNLESLQQYALDRLSYNAKEVVRFLNGLLGINEREDKTGFLHLPNPDDEYRFVADIVPPDRMIDFIRQAFRNSDIKHAPVAVHWFVKMYDRESSSQSNST